jgi:hypothetical protein
MVVEREDNGRMVFETGVTNKIQIDHDDGNALLGKGIVGWDSST